MTAVITLPANGRNSRRRFRTLLRRWLRVIHASRKYQNLYFLCLTVGFFGWLLNLKQTSAPLSTYEHDVFDSISHLPSFLAFKTVLFFSWVLIYPAVGFLVISTAYATWRILREAELEGLIAPQMEHPDECYGLRSVGTLNISILIPYLLVIFSTYSIIETHDTVYASVMSSVVVISLLFIWTSYIVIQPVYSILASARRKACNDLIMKMESRQRTAGARVQFLLERLVYSAASASPYSVEARVTLVAMQVLSTAPLASAFL